METINLTELSSKEMKEVNGGWIGPLLLGVALAGIVTDWAEFKSGLVAGASRAAY